ncbi:hypothetical protein PGTUg99_021383 [Puccinia graminis f. sp. tritici]|uniref:Uncharacterized protein n=1 Tax=Puccinia graminis f. sp. tritici TaxID=56615 RepID=A0A5B0R6A5_PUCGR|nr:hypothetical protein PGTUg99_021383 [Puccinia graminis f. sp. tritici]
MGKRGLEKQEVKLNSEFQRGRGSSVDPENVPDGGSIHVSRPWAAPLATGFVALRVSYHRVEYNQSPSKVESKVHGEEFTVGVVVVVFGAVFGDDRACCLGCGWGMGKGTVKSCPLNSFEGSLGEQ